MNQSTLSEDEWVSGISRAKTQHGYLLSGFLAIVGLAFILFLNEASPDASLIGGLQMGFAALVFLMVYRNSKRSKRLLVLNGQGIWYVDWRMATIPWKSIKSAEIKGSRIKSAVHVTLSDPDSLLDLIDPAERTKFARNPLVRLPDLKIPAGQVQASLNEIVERIDRYVSTAN